MKKIGISTLTINSNYIWDETNDETRGIGGSEIWAINIANEFVKRGYDVYVFGNPLQNHVSKTGVHYFKQEYLNNNLEALEFDYFISSRFIFEKLPFVKADKKILMLHDTQIIGCSSFDDLIKCGITSIAYQSDFQKYIVSRKYMIPETIFFKTTEGIDVDFYNTFNLEKKNKMVFSSGKGRGLYWFIENVFPKIRKEVPDFEVEIAGYFDSFNELIFKQEGIKVLGNLSKSELAKRQCESKIWIYPNHGYDSYFNTNEETFCITAIENGAAKNACILSDWGCWKTTFNGYDGFVGNELITNFTEPMDYDKLDEFADILANDAIKCLKDEDYRQKKAKSAYDCSIKYTWEYACNSFEIEFENTNEYERTKSVRILLCCIGRLENRYIREFVEFYRNIGVTNICLYDNNRDGEDNFNDAIGDYISNGFVILKDYRNMKPPVQFLAYNECYKEYGKLYDWIMFFDIDEFMFINQDRDLKTYLSRDMFNGFNMIHVNWLNFGDGGNVYYENKPILERIKEPINLDSRTDYNFPDNFHIKSIVRGGLDNVVFKSTPHTPEITGRCCNGSGIECNPNSPFLPYDYRFSGIRHFTTKTADEFADKVKRGFCDTNVRGGKSLIEQFFTRNEVTEEKVEVFKKKCGIDVSYLLPKVFKGEKNKDIKIYTLCYDKKNFQFLNDSVITPLQVGASNGTNVCELKDNTGDNISDKNYFYVENTGTYWIWKNVEGAKYKGQMQYRRPLSGIDENFNFEEIFNNYDVITCIPFNHPENKIPTKEQPMCIPADTVEEGYAFSNCADDLTILEMVIKMYHPDYAEDYDKYIKKGENLYYSNGFIMSSENYDKYAEFMYDCLTHYLAFAQISSFEDLIEHVKYNLEVGKYIRYKGEEIHDNRVLEWQSKIGGFLSERIWTLWLQHNFSRDKIYEVPYVKMENNMYT